MWGRREVGGGGVGRERGRAVGGAVSLGGRREIFDSGGEAGGGGVVERKGGMSAEREVECEFFC